MFTVLLVDDEFFERDGLRFLIQKGGYDVRVMDAPDGKAALKIIRDEPIDVLISDIRMPSMDGLELSRRVREIDPDMRILIYTAYSEFEYAQRAIEFGVSGYLLKPIQRDRFYHEFEKVLVESRTIRAGARDTPSSGRRPGARRPDRRHLPFAWMQEWPHGVNGDEGGLAERQVDDPRPAHRHLMMVCFEDAFFLSHVQTFEQSFCGRTEGLWVLDLSRALLLFASPGAPDDDALREAGRGLQDDVRELFRSTPSILIARMPGDVDRGGEAAGSPLSDAVMLLEEHSSTRLFEPGCVKLLDGTLPPADDDLYQQLEQIRLGVHGLLEKNDIIGVRVRLDSLEQLLESGGDLSALYLKNAITEITHDIISHLGMESTERRKALEEIWTTNGRRSLIGLVKRYAQRLEGASFPGEPDDTAVGRILDLIHNEYQNDLTLDAIAARVFMTPSYVSFLFKRHTGQTLMRYLTWYRMECAAKLLAGTSRQITEITSLVGYDNPSYFSSVFRTCFGQTPTSYRKDRQRPDR